MSATPRRRSGAAHRDHLFISYAWEDAALCEWLWRKLTAQGYAVWCDRFELLAGADWPRDIDVAIKTRTFRMLAIISTHSLTKPNPSKERTLALSIARERNCEFLIPLNAEDIPPSELPWGLSDVQYVPFRRWDEGLSRLLSTLEAIDTPKPHAVDGPSLAVRSYLPTPVTLPTAEPVYANCLRVTAIPDVIHCFTFTRRLFQSEERELSGRWAFHTFGPTNAWAFTDPPAGAVESWSATRSRSSVWRDVHLVDRVPSRDIVSALIRKSLMVRCVALHLERDANGRSAFFTDNMLPDNRIRFVGHRGRLTRVDVVGERKRGEGRNRYRLGLTFAPRETAGDGMMMEIKIRLLMSDPQGALDAHVANARRKLITKNWWNHEWLQRQMALAAFLARGGAPPTTGPEPTEFGVGPDGREQVRFSAELFKAYVTPSIDEAELSRMKAFLKAIQSQIADDEAQESDVLLQEIAE